MILLAIALIFLVGNAIIPNGEKAPKGWRKSLDQLTESIKNNKQDGQFYLSSIEEHKEAISTEWNNYEQYIKSWENLNTQIISLEEKLMNSEKPLLISFEVLNKGFKHSIDSIEVFRRASERSIFSTILFQKGVLIQQMRQKQLELEGLSAKKTEIIETLLVENDSLSEEMKNLQATIAHLLDQEEMTLQKIADLILAESDNENTIAKTRILIKDLESREIELLQEKEELEAKIAQFLQISCELANKSFNARYWIKEGKQKGKLVELDKIFKHKRRLIKKIEVEFMLCDNMISSAETPEILVELTDAASNIIQSKAGSAIDIQSTQATTIFSLDRRLKKGAYYFLVSEKGIPLFEYEFKVD